MHFLFCFFLIISATPAIWAVIVIIVHVYAVVRFIFTYAYCMYIERQYPRDSERTLKKARTDRTRQYLEILKVY
jgi:glucan phosphoethanolaminetransferase (alkaline phosphatase superfamily)